ncbi:MAG: putative hybrid glycoside hydrolase, group 92(-20) family protein precursor [Bacteroidetes bacterium]|jgi:predicted alpha-1,2-mannosidase|nr:putative hybrid glycoside hydrolase, group 92(-20) family protein precursor [Bacteroidota bacterium]
MRILIVFVFISSVAVAQKTPVSFVNPFIGTGWHGHTFPGAVVPFGMVQLSPDTRIDGSWDGCSGYHYNDSLIYGFSHTHLSGTGCSDFGDILLMPMPGTASADNKKYASEFKHTNEKASAGLYSVKLQNGTEVELTATTRVGIHKYTFPKNELPNVILDLTHRDETTQSYVKVTGDKTLEGERFSKAWATDQRIYYAIEFSEKFDWEIFLNDKSQKGQLLKDNYYSGKNVKAILSFPDQKGKTILVKVGISNVSVEGAKKNLAAEAKDWNFDNYKKSAEALWNKELGKIQVSTENKEKATVFYTALYHCMIHPSMASDVDGSYRGRDMKVHKADGFDYYSVFSLWDTYRGLHPLLTLIDKKRTEDFIKTFIAQYEQGGRLPVWELAGNETDCMIGYHSVAVITDAYIKGITGFDAQKAYAAMKNSAMEDRLGLKAYKQNGVISADDESESVSRTLEYAYDDWCIAQMAKKLGKTEDYKLFINRSMSWRNVFDRQSAFMRARKNGNWQQPFDPREVNNNFTEANSYQYSFYVPQDIEGLIEAHGNATRFEKKLTKLFLTESKTTGREQSDITGLIGQYAHGNEPSHHMAYLFNYAGKYNKTVEYVDAICKDFYSNNPYGLIGNEDCGQMSAWYVLSSLGFYPVCPGSPDFVLGKPQFTELNITLHTGSKMKISRPVDYTSKNASGVNFSLNNQPYKKLFISTEDLLKGGQFTFTAPKESEVADSLATGWILPSSKISDAEFVPLPLIKTGNSFTDTMRIVLQNNSRKGQLFFRTDSTAKFMPYKNKAISIGQTTKIEVYEQAEKFKSGIVSAKVYKRPNKWTVKIAKRFNKQYTAGGEIGILDGIRGDLNWKKGEWQGYQSTDFEAVVDMLELRTISEAKIGLLQDTRAWILFPTVVEVYVSADGTKFEKAGIFENKKAADEYTVQIQDLGGKIDTGGQKIRYVKFIAKNHGKLPEWHQGRGGDAFIFVDELLIK